MAAVAVLMVLAVSLSSVNGDESADGICMEVKNGVVLVLQPSMRPRLGGSFYVEGLDQSLFTVHHMIGPCQPTDPSMPHEDCDLLWIDGKFLSLIHTEGSFLVNYTATDSEESFGVILFHGVKGIEFKAPDETFQKPEVTEKIEVFSRNSVCKIVSSQNVDKTVLECIGNIEENDYFLSYMSLLRYPCATEPLDSVTRVTFGPHLIEKPIMGIQQFSMLTLTCLNPVFYFNTTQIINSSDIYSVIALEFWLQIFVLSLLALEVVLLLVLLLLLISDVNTTKSISSKVCGVIHEIHNQVQSNKLHYKLSIHVGAYVLSGVLSAMGFSLVICAINIWISVYAFDTSEFLDLKLFIIFWLVIPVIFSITAAFKVIEIVLTCYVLIFTNWAIIYIPHLLLLEVVWKMTDLLYEPHIVESVETKQAGFRSVQSSKMPDEGKNLPRLAGVGSLYGCISSVPFVKGIEVCECDKQGATITINDDIIVCIPTGAIPEGVSVHVEVGVALFGPFSFDKHYQPVSPILWFCTQEDVEFLVPLTFQLPHALMDIKGVKLCFVKANYSSKGVFIFTKEIGTPTDSKFEAGSGYFYSKHGCFLCIVNRIDKSLSIKKGYCLHVLVKQEDALTYRIVVVCTYFFGTCTKALKEMFSEDYEHKFKQRFQFKDASTPYLIATPSNEDNLQLTLEESNKILASEIDFWSRDYDLEEMQLMHDEKIYPPHITIVAHSEKCQYATITLEIKGIKTSKDIDSDETDETLFHIPKQFGSPTIAATASNPVTVPDKPLQMDSHFNLIYTILCKSVAPKWEHFSTYLDVKPTSVDLIVGKKGKDDIQGCFRELIKEWLRQVKPPATKSKIIEVLRELDLHTEADKLEKKL